MEETIVESAVSLFHRGITDARSGLSMAIDAPAYRRGYESIWVMRRIAAGIDKPTNEMIAERKAAHVTETPARDR